MVCLCGITRFLDAFDRAGLAETLAGRVVLSIGSTHVGDDEVLAGMSALERDDALARLARLLQGWDQLVLVDALPSCGSPGRLEIIEVRPEHLGVGELDAHGMGPDAVLSSLGALGGRLPPFGWPAATYRPGGRTGQRHRRPDRSERRGGGRSPGGRGRHTGFAS